MDIDLDPDYYLGSQYYALLLVESSTLTVMDLLRNQPKEMETISITQNQLGRDHGNML